MYDLSATPFFLKGSGYSEGTLFPWVVSDFGLVDAIEAGTGQDSPGANRGRHGPGGRALRRTGTCGEGFGMTSRRRGGKQTPVGVSPQLPAPLQGALHSLYANYQKAFERWDDAGTDDRRPLSSSWSATTRMSRSSSTTTSRDRRSEQDGSSTTIVPGALGLFSNEQAGGWTHRPVTILVDSEQLDRGDALSPEFKRAASAEIEQFKTRVLESASPGADVESLTDEDILREVMNTVGKPGRLGSNVRCVVSVSMLTEGWDATTVTHILGVRAFGTQLLCEQVVGRGLRRRSFAA